MSCSQLRKYFPCDLQRSIHSLATSGANPHPVEHVAIRATLLLQSGYPLAPASRAKERSRSGGVRPGDPAGHRRGVGVCTRGKQTFKTSSGKDATAESIVAWTNTYKGKTKVFATTLGHNNTTVGDDKYLDLVTRGLLWSVGKLDDAHLKPAKKVLLDD